MEKVVKHIQLEQEQFAKQELSEQPKPPVVSLTDIAITRSEVLEIRLARKAQAQQRNKQAEDLKEWLQRNAKV